MNDRPLNSCYYSHIAAITLFTGCRSVARPPNKKKRKGHLCLHPPSFFLPFPNLLSEQLYGVCECWKGGTLPYPKKKLLDSLSFLLCTHTPEALVFVPWGPGVFRSQGSRLGIGAGSCSPPPAGPGSGRGRAERPLLSPHPPRVAGAQA